MRPAVSGVQAAGTVQKSCSYALGQAHFADAVGTRLACRIILSPDSCQGRSASADVCEEEPSGAGLVIELRAGHAGIR